MRQEEPQTSEQLAAMFWRLREERETKKHALEKRRRPSLSREQRDRILEKTAGRCHICGGRVGLKWQADHVLTHSTGGAGSAENYLPAHPICNNYRWNYLPEELEYVMKLGVWTKTQIERRTRVGRLIADPFLEYDRRRRARRKENQIPPQGPSLPVWNGEHEKGSDL